MAAEQLVCCGVAASLSRFSRSSSALTDVSVIHGSPQQLMELVERYEAYISEEWYQPWDSYAWVAGEL